MSPNPMLDAALQYHHAGISIIPILPGGEKKPALAWKQYTQTPPTEQQVHDWWGNNPQWGIATISGEVSGNLLMIELEAEAAKEATQLKELAHNSGLGQLWERITSGWWEVSPAGGLHWFLRSTEPVPGNQKLARTPEHKVLAETRGEGGYTIVSPTGPKHHASGKPWTRVNGGPNTIAVVTPEELDNFLTLFRTLNQDEPPTKTYSPPTFPQQTGNRLRPGDDYNNQATWDEIIGAEGWTPIRTRGQTTEWRRPGKNTGISATTGHAQDKDRLYVFTTSTTFEPETPYDKFAAYTHLHHNGDYETAAKALATKGYGEEDVTTQIENDFHTNLPRPVDNLHTIQGGQNNNQPSTDGANALQPRLHNATINLKELNDTTNATYFVDTCKDLIRHIADTDTWAHWNGHKWEQLPNNAAPIVQLAQQAFRALKDADKALENWCNKSLNRAPLKNTLALAATDPRVTTTASQYDQHHEELNTPTGILNLRTGQLTPNDPTKLHSKATAVIPDPNQPTPKWDKFLADTFAGHDGMSEYVQQLAGYAATGLVTAQILPFLYGSGANGKSVFVDVITNLLGDYAAAAPPGFLTQQQQQHSTEMAMLEGVRFTTASEVAEGSKFDEVKIKLLTGGDQITARKMREDFSSFQPTHKIWVTGNHQPKVTSGGYSFWRRLRLVPFTNTVPEKDQNVYLARELIEEEGPGILAWITKGSQIFLQHGFTEPEEVTQATKAYEESEDELGRFMADRVIIGAGEHARVPYKEMRAAYTEWCSLEGLTPTTANMFTRELKARFNVGTGRTKQGRFYTNATLASLEPENDYEENSSWNDLGGGF